MAPTPTVLVYDDAFETSEVLAAVYEPRGFQVERIAAGPAGTEGHGEGNTVVRLRSPSAPSHPNHRPPFKVLIGRATAGLPAVETGHVAACRLSSLFDYRELVGAIDRLLCDRD
jgi:hypothetical protein